MMQLSLNLFLLNVMIVCHVLSPRYLRLWKPWCTVFTVGIINCDLLLRLYWSAFLKEKRSFKISSEIPQCILYIFIARHLRFLWCIETDLSLFKRFWKDVFLSFYIKSRHLSCILFILLFFVRLWHIQMKKAIIELRQEDCIH